MSEQLQLRSGTATQVAAFTGALGEVVADTTNHRLVLHDGVTAGGWAAAKLSEVAALSRTSVNDVSYTALTADRIIAYTTITASRTVTLPAAASFPQGATLWIADESGACSTSVNIVISRSGSDVVDGLASAVLNAAYDSICLMSNGVGKWTLLVDALNQEFSLLSVGTAPDPSNVLSVAGASALFNGANFSVYLNKSAATNTCSFVFEDAFSARAQMGLNGSDNFSFKVSPNGSTWTNSLVFDATTGAPTFANQRTPISDSAYSALVTDRLIAYIALTAARIVTLPSAAAFPAGHRLVVIDESGACSASNAITLARAGTDTINGATSAVIASAYGSVEIESSGGGGWTIIEQSLIPATAAPSSDGTAAVGASLLYARQDHVHPSDATKASLAGATFTGALVAPVGTATLAPIKLQSGASLTAAAAGVFEFDGTVGYFSPAASTRGVMCSEYIEALTAAYTLTSQTAAQKLLNGTSNGTVTIPVGTYQFECRFSLTSLSATSGSFGFALGGTATFTQSWEAIATQPAALATATASQTTYNAAANTALTSASTNTTGHAIIKGIVRVTVAGTIIPQVSLTIAAATIVGANSYFKISPLGAAAVVSVGNWS